MFREPNVFHRLAERRLIKRVTRHRAARVAIDLVEDDQGEPLIETPDAADEQQDSRFVRVEASYEELLERAIDAALAEATSPVIDDSVQVIPDGIDRNRVIGLHDE